MNKAVAVLCLLAAPALARSVVIVAAPPTPTAPQAGAGWSANAVGLRTQVGLLAVVDCPPRGKPGSSWGSGPYTDDSSICGAAVHAGFIQVAAGGRVMFEVLPGRSSYAGSTSHGISTGGWGSWHGSFMIRSAQPLPAPTKGATRTISWTDDANVLTGGVVETLLCPAQGSAGAVWGSAIYTDDSSICTAAVHAGIITFARGGAVRVELRPGQASYPGSQRNGVTSSGWGKWGGSLVVR